MNIYRKTIAAFLLLAGCSLVNAHDFSATVDGQKLFFNIKSKTNIIIVKLIKYGNALFNPLKSKPSFVQNDNKVGITIDNIANKLPPTILVLTKFL